MIKKILAALQSHVHQINFFVYLSKVFLSLQLHFNLSFLLKFNIKLDLVEVLKKFEFNKELKYNHIIISYTIRLYKFEVRIQNIVVQEHQYMVSLMIIIHNAISFHFTFSIIYHIYLVFISIKPSIEILFN